MSGFIKGIVVGVISFGLGFAVLSLAIPVEAPERAGTAPVAPAPDPVPPAADAEDSARPSLSEPVAPAEPDAGALAPAGRGEDISPVRGEALPEAVELMEDTQPAAPVLREDAPGASESGETGAGTDPVDAARGDGDDLPGEAPLPSEEAAASEGVTGAGAPATDPAATGEGPPADARQSDDLQPDDVRDEIPDALAATTEAPMTEPAETDAPPTETQPSETPSPEMPASDAGTADEAADAVGSGGAEMDSDSEPVAAAPDDDAAAPVVAGPETASRPAPDTAPAPAPVESGPEATIETPETEAPLSEAPATDTAGTDTLEAEIPETETPETGSESTAPDPTPETMAPGSPAAEDAEPGEPARESLDALAPVPAETMPANEPLLGADTPAATALPRVSDMPSGTPDVTVRRPGDGDDPAVRRLGSGGGRLPGVGETIVVSPDAAGSAAPEADPDAPAIRRFAATPEIQPDQRPLGVVLIDSPEAETGVLALPVPVTIALDPFDADAPRRARAYRDAGHEIALRAARLPALASASDIALTLDFWQREFPQTALFVDVPINGLGANAPLARDFAGMIAPYGYGVVALRNGLDAFLQAARGNGLPATSVYRALDDEDQGEFTIRRLIDRAAFEALRQDGIVVMGDAANRATMTELADFTAGSGRAGVALTPVSTTLIGTP
ncbi:divergent polysaccharide deacetylase family protein [Pararhodobacter marinus]|uniref:divergent polysaccharide deacetylase family protein n=1 Tax=Pararhodobacter marinus TaxID=2184063 RepID=UPI0035112702